MSAARRIATLLALAAAVAPPLEASAPAEAPEIPAYRIERLLLRIELDPESGILKGVGELELQTAMGEEGGELPPLVLALHPDLTLEAASGPEGTLAFHRRPAAEAQASEAGDSAAGEGEDEGEAPEPALWELAWKPTAAGSVSLAVVWSGRLREDVAAGEKAGQIHNFRVRAHIAPEGVHLSDEAAWYPRLPEGDDEATPEARRELEPLLFELTVRQVPGLVMVASGDRSESDPEPGWTTWRSPFPLSGIALHGGPHQVHRRSLEGLTLRVHLPLEAAAFAGGVLDALESYLELYQPLLGAYPFRELTVVENFFSSGFAYPGFTVLGPGVLEMGPGALRPGYLDHEMLHNWWGNGVLPSRRSGNWLEALTSYCANYMRPVLEGRPEEARRQRRDVTQRLSRVSDPQPLARFGEKDGPGNLIGYQKGSLVFALLADEVGQETLWKGLRRLFTERRGMPTGWEDLRRVVEKESGRDLAAFFDFWVDQPGLPELAVEEALWEAGEHRLRLSVRRSGPPGPPLKLPLRVRYPDGGAAEIAVTVSGEGGVLEVGLPAGSPAPEALEVDPDARTLRQVPAQILMPTLSGIFGPRPLTLFQAPGDLAGYGTVADVVRQRYEEKFPDAVTMVQAGFEAARLGEGHALILGEAALTPDGAALLEAASVRLEPGRFVVGDEVYGEPGDALLVCRRHQAHPGGVLCVYRGNAEEALARAYLLTFYGGNSLLIFRGGSPVHRQDFELTERVPVTSPQP